MQKLREGSGQLGEAAARRLEELSAMNPQWQLATNERDEFPHWTSGTGDPDYKARRDIEQAPRRRKDLVAWLKQPTPERRPLYEDTWEEICRTRFFHAFFALCDLAKDGVWPAERWQEALQAWNDEGRVRRSRQFAAPLVQRMPGTVMLEVIHGVTWWMEMASKSLERHETILLSLCRCVLELPSEPSTGIYQNGEPVNNSVVGAINHPIGRVTQALLNLWFRHVPEDNDSLLPDIKPFFTQLCDLTVERFRHGRVLLASHLIALFRVDRSWTEAHLLPLFDWNRNLVEAKAAWEGFLWFPRLYRPLLIAFKPQFLSTVHFYENLGTHSSQFAAILTQAALEPVDGYVPEDFQAAIGALPQDGLTEVAQALLQALESAGEQREDYWKNRVQPFWHGIWPKSRGLMSTNIADSMARLCIAAGGEFSAALSAVVDWLQPIEHAHSIVLLLQESGLCNRFPDASLRLLNAILNDHLWAPTELGQCLDAIAQVMLGLRHDHRYQKLLDYSRRRGG